MKMKKELMEKYEWRKKEKEFYLPKEKPVLVNVPKFKFILLKGQGNPNNEDFSEVVSTLYSVAYGIKMAPKKGIDIDGYYDYTVYPLEGEWDLTQIGRQLDYLNKDELVYTLMIRQPDFVTEDIVHDAIKRVKEKASNPLLDQVKFESIEEGLCVQMLHIGSYDDEPASFDVMEHYCLEHSLHRMSKKHREIYLSDARRIESHKQKTVLRFNVEKI
jgi:hypothetical protein